MKRKDYKKPTMQVVKLQQRMHLLRMLAAILTICGASVFTACTGDISDIPVKPVGIAIDETNFPDAAFRQCLFDYYKFAKDGILTDEEIKNTTTLEVDWEDIKNLKGIEYFTALEELDCSGNDLTEFDLSMNINCIILIVVTTTLLSSISLITCCWILCIVTVTN